MAPGVGLCWGLYGYHGLHLGSECSWLTESIPCLTVASSACCRIFALTYQTPLSHSCLESHVWFMLGHKKPRCGSFKQDFEVRLFEPFDGRITRSLEALSPIPRTRQRSRDQPPVPKSPTSTAAAVDPPQGARSIDNPSCEDKLLAFETWAVRPPRPAWGRPPGQDGAYTRMGVPPETAGPTTVLPYPLNATP